MLDRLSCTVCGRTIPSGEWARIKRADTGDGYKIVVACELHDPDSDR